VFILGFRSVCEEDLDNLLVQAIPEKIKVAAKYGLKFFHGKDRSEKELISIFFV